MKMNKESKQVKEATTIKNKNMHKFKSETESRAHGEIM